MRLIRAALVAAALVGGGFFVGTAQAQYPEVGPIEIYQGWWNDNHWVLYQQADGSTFWVCEYCHWG